MTSIWIDALTSKQGTMFGYIAKELIRRGFNVIVTCREYEYTVSSLIRLGLRPLVIGSYSEGSRYDKVKADIDRMKGLIDIVRKFKPDALIAYPNPPAARTSFGVGIPYIALTDSPHSEIPSRLALPLATHVLFSEAIPREEIIKYLYDNTAITQYRGVDELFWLLRCRPSKDYVEYLGLEPLEYVVLRPHEYKATYYRGIKVSVNIEGLVKRLSNMGLEVVLLPRYSQHVALARRLVKDGLKVKVITGGYDGVSLARYALAVISGGSSMAREAALLGTPGITYYPGKIYVNEYLEKLGFPIIKCSSNDEIIDVVKSSSKLRGDFLSRLKEVFDDPMGKLIRVLQEVIGR